MLNAPIGRRLGVLLSGGWKKLREIISLDQLAVLAALALAVILRLALIDFKSLDYYASLKPWYNAIRSQGFAVFATDFSTYNPPYLYLLYLIARFLPGLPVEAAVKLPSLAADFACAYVVSLIVRSFSPGRRYLPYIAGLATLFTPTVVLNSAFWGQADSIFAAGILASVYLLAIRRPLTAMLAFGFALAFKLQAIFLLPLLLALTLKGQISWKALLVIPSMLLLAILPSWAAGRPFGELFGVYIYQASQFEFITMNAPSAFALVPDTKRVFNLLYIPGLFLGAAVALIWFTVLRRSRHLIEGRLLVQAALASMLLIPLFLPKMHERYFFPADLLSLCLGFIEPSLFAVPIMIIGISFLSYQPFLFERSYVPLLLLAVILVGITAYLTHRTVVGLYQADAPAPPQGSAVMPQGEDEARNGERAL